VRASLRDGIRAVRRYPTLWVAFGVFGFTYALFQLGIRVYLSTVLPTGEQSLFLWSRAVYRPEWSWFVGLRDSLWYLPHFMIPAIARAAVLPALDGVAGLFNNLVSTFPVASLAALLFLVNWKGHHGVMVKALHRRFGRLGWFIHGGMVGCALAAFAKPLLYFLPQFVNPELWFRWSPIAAWLAFLFEYLFGVCIQVYLLLLSYCWVRGINFRHSDLLDFAIRRFSSVFRWAVVVMILSSVLIDLPLILKNFAPFTEWFGSDPGTIDRRSLFARLLLDLCVLSCATVQVTLTFHGESLGRALRDHLHFVWRNAWPLAWFITIAGLHFYLLHLINLLVQTGAGDGTALWLAWTLFFPWLAGGLGAWFLAAWLSFFQRADTGRLHDEEWIKF
jgi:hypothetical protein